MKKNLPYLLMVIIFSAMILSFGCEGESSSLTADPEENYEMTSLFTLSHVLTAFRQADILITDERPCAPGDCNALPQPDSKAKTIHAFAGIAPRSYELCIYEFGNREDLLVLGEKIMEALEVERKEKGGEYAFRIISFGNVMIVEPTNLPPEQMKKVMENIEAISGAP